MILEDFVIENKIKTGAGLKKLLKKSTLKVVGNSNSHSYGEIGTLIHGKDLSNSMAISLRALSISGLTTRGNTILFYDLEVVGASFKNLQELIDAKLKIVSKEIENLEKERSDLSKLAEIGSPLKKFKMCDLVPVQLANTYQIDLKEIENIKKIIG